MRYYLHNNIINYNVVTRNYCHGTRRGFSTSLTVMFFIVLKGGKSGVN